MPASHLKKADRGDVLQDFFPTRNFAGERFFDRVSEHLLP
jgi:hypothetical protein